MRYEREDYQTHANTRSIWPTKDPCLARSAKKVKVDITIGERLVLPLAVVRGYTPFGTSRVKVTLTSAA